MSNALAYLSYGLLIWASLVPRALGSGSDLPRCNCDDEGSLWSMESILECQRVSDFLIAVAYFSIPIELLYFVSCSNVPFKWVLFQFIAFIVLCGMTHLLNGWTYNAHPFQLMLALTVFKILTALVSCATAITLITLIPLLLKVKVREFMLKKKTWDLGREVGMIMKQRETGLHVRMLTQEIRKSLDRHTILSTTLLRALRGARLALLRGVDARREQDRDGPHARAEREELLESRELLDPDRGPGRGEDQGERGGERSRAGLGAGAGPGSGDRGARPGGCDQNADAASMQFQRRDSRAYPSVLRDPASGPPGGGSRGLGAVRRSRS